MRRQCASSRGFTLMEVLVAMLLFAIMSTLAYGSYRNARQQSEALEASAARTRELQTAVNLLVMDLEQLMPRPSRELIGDGHRPALRSGVGGAALELTRGGYPNGAGLPRGTLQRVTYRLEGARLLRESTAVVDATPSTPLLKRELLGRVRALTFRFLTPTRVWIDAWPAPDTPPEQIGHQRPIAVEFMLETEDFGKIVRLVEVPG
ncbi:MAG: type II secretion system minor pseudopilin GspJ [Gammaproteobacteria bacterium]